jgi:hypothetical protein
MASIVTLLDVEDDIPIALWAKENCTSFTGWLVVDMAPDSLNTDYRFYFEDDRDVTNFIMRWQGQYESVQ